MTKFSIRYIFYRSIGHKICILGTDERELSKKVSNDTLLDETYDEDISNVLTTDHRLAADDFRCVKNQRKDCVFNRR